MNTIPRHFVTPPFIDWCELHVNEPNTVHVRYTYSRFAERGLSSYALHIVIYASGIISARVAER